MDSHCPHQGVGKARRVGSKSGPSQETDLKRRVFAILRRGGKETLMKSILVAILIALALTATQAQTTGGTTTITGQVKDPQGANVPGAKVTLYARDRTFSLVTATDSSG